MPLNDGAARAISGASVMGLDALHRIDITVEDPCDPTARKRFLAVNAVGWPGDDEARLTLH